MIAVDTNFIVRLLVGDDTKQQKIAETLFQSETIYISKTVILEVEWVLRYCYELPCNKIFDAFEKLFGLDNVIQEELKVVGIALGWARDGLDFADAMHLASGQMVKQFSSFDKKFVNQANKIQDYCEIMYPV